MIATPFKIAFSLSLSHSYFKKGICNCMEFKAGKITRKLQQKFDLKISNNNTGGFDFYISTMNTLPGLLTYLKQTNKASFFDFEMESNHPGFFNFTDFPMDSLGKMEYSSSSTLNTMDEKTIQLVGQDGGPISNKANVGHIKIYFNDLIDQPEASFSISLKAKATQWQYFIINQSAVPLEQPLIAGKNDFTFTGPESVVLESGITALLFTSGKQLIPLSETPDYKFDLLNRPDTGQYGGTSKLLAKTISKALPNPDPYRFGKVVVDGHPQFSSPMYVYL